MTLTMTQIEVMDAIVTYLNLNPKTNPMTKTLNEELSMALASLSDDQLQEFKNYCRANRKFENKESSYDRFMNTFENYLKLKNEDKKQRLLGKAETKIDNLLNRISKSRVLMGKKISTVESLELSARVIGMNLIKSNDYSYDHLKGIVKNAMAKRFINHLNELEYSFMLKLYEQDVFKGNLKPFTPRVTEARLFQESVLHLEICNYCDMHIKSKQNLINKLNKNRFGKEETQKRIEEIKTEISELNHSKNLLRNMLKKLMPIVKNNLSINYREMLSFKELTHGGGQRIFTDVEVRTLDAIGFEKIFNSDIESVRDMLRDTVLKYNKVENQIGASKVQALLSKASGKV